LIATWGRFAKVLRHIKLALSGRHTRQSIHEEAAKPNNEKDNPSTHHMMLSSPSPTDGRFCIRQGNDGEHRAKDLILLLHG